MSSFSRYRVLDLLEQSSQEFEARGLVVKTANTRQELMEQFRLNQALDGDSGNDEITVFNIQRFAEDKHRVDLPPYATNLQRIFIMDETSGKKMKNEELSSLIFESITLTMKVVQDYTAASFFTPARKKD